MEDAKRPANCVKRSGKILPNRKHLNQVSRDGEVLSRKQSRSLSVWSRLSAAFLPHSYAFGSAGKEKFQIPPNAELKYEVHLKSFEKVRLVKSFPILKSGATL